MTPEVGDLIFYPITPSSGWFPRLIAWGEKLIGQAPSAKGYSHVAVCGPDPQHQYEAWFPKIRNTSIRIDGAEVYSIKDINGVQIAQMMAYAQAHVGEWYDWLAIITLGKLQLGGTDVCSQFAYDTALAAGIVLGVPEAFISPDDDAVSKLLIRRS